MRCCGSGESEYPVLYTYIFFQANQSVVWTHGSCPRRCRLHSRSSRRTAESCWCTGCWCTGTFQDKLINHIKQTQKFHEWIRLKRTQNVPRSYAYWMKVNPTKISLTVGRDKGFVFRGETLVNVGRVRLKCDGHHVASNGDHLAFWLPATQSTTQRRFSRPVSESVSLSEDISAGGQTTFH